MLWADQTRGRVAAAGAIRASSSEELLAPTNLPALGAWPDRYGIGLL
jgi:hypothetical protein